MTVHVVTSFNKKGFEEYGLRCIESFDKFWPNEVALHVVSEDIIDFPTGLFKHRSFKFYNLNQESVNANLFHSKHHDNPRAHGRGKEQLTRANRHWTTGYSFRHDAYKFSKKVFAIELVAKSIEPAKLIWLDADTVTFSALPMDMLERMPPERYAIACLERGRYHSECGFVAYDLLDPKAVEFITEFAKLYVSDEVFKLQEWHDSWVFDWLRKKLRVPTWGIPYTSVVHPFVYSELGQYMDHMKGRRKSNGVSHDHPKYTRAQDQKVGNINASANDSQKKKVRRLLEDPLADISDKPVSKKHRDVVTPKHWNRARKAAHGRR